MGKRLSARAPTVRVRKKRTSRPALRRRKGVLQLFSAVSASGRRTRTRKKSTSASRLRLWGRVRRTVILGGLLVVATALVGVAVRSVLRVKTATIDDPSVESMRVGKVVGLTGIPAYPGSEFLFANSVDEDVVKRFLARRQSAYSLPPDAQWDDVAAYYQRELEQRGWVYVLTVPLADEMRMPGEYFVFESAEVTSPDDEIDIDVETGMNSQSTAMNSTDGGDSPAISLGLRIYPHTGGIWYEEITSELARSGLAEEIAQEEEIALLLQMGSLRELPEDFPWKLSYPEIWSAEVRTSRLDEAPLVEFSGGETVATVTVEPIAYFDGRAVSEYIQPFVDEVNSRRPAGTEFSVEDAGEVQVGGQGGYQVRLKISQNPSEEPDGMVAVVVHPGNGIVYAVTSFEGEVAFFSYVLQNLEVR
ncbi:MAG: hypothetical protein PHG63_03585 [Candidatus Dojkabacteria bacterium]|nr:hypothetical protein [Candidatus Dojkabacteria bacterium]